MSAFNFNFLEIQFQTLLKPCTLNLFVLVLQFCMACMSSQLMMNLLILCIQKKQAIQINNLFIYGIHAQHFLVSAWQVNLLI